MDVKREILDLLDAFGLAKHQEIAVNVRAGQDQIDRALCEMVKIGCVKFDGKHFWRAEL